MASSFDVHEDQLCFAPGKQKCFMESSSCDVLGGFFLSEIALNIILASLCFRRNLLMTLIDSSNKTMNTGIWRCMLSNSDKDL